jgi:hypothetical protein
VSRSLSVLLPIYLFVAGIYFMMVPWSVHWDRICFGWWARGTLGAVLRSGYTRGAVAGFGVAHLVLCVSELIALRRRGKGDGGA